MKEKTAAGLWKKLEQICMLKTLTNKLHMKQRLYAHRLEKGAERVSLFVGDKIGMLMMIVEGHRNRILAVNLRVDRSLQTEIKIKREVGNQKGKQPENSDEADIVEDYSDGELLVASANNSKVNEESIFDSGCTFHMSPNQDWFTTYETVSEGVILIENNASYKIVSVGTIKIKMFDGVIRTLSDVRHVPELKRNLILLSTLDSKAYKYTTENKGFTVTNDAAVASSSLSDNDITKLWHMCQCHMSENGMAELSKRGLLNGQGNYKLKFCEHCIFGKQKRVRFTRGIHNTKGTTRREIKPPKKYVEAELVAYALNVVEDIDANQEPSNYSETVSCDDSEKWIFAMQEEMKSLHKNRTWDLVLKHNSIQALFGIVAMHDLELEQLDVKTAFLHGELKEDIYMQQPKGFTVSKKEGYVCLKKSLYGLKRHQDSGTRGLSAKPVNTPLVAHFRLSSALFPQLDDEIEYMSHVPYSSAVGSLMYAMFGRTRDRVIGYVDADFAGDLNRRRSLTGYVFTIRGCAISWKATLQTTVALSTTKAKYMAILVKKPFS
ncbi:hypothetical protein CXB51_017075 [Gossypium anomalum]|uniref:Reverse transcriptase Ty1/copia-type domain-containing protein n=1 Tax=Gossypium anomalum TaxID=47600 RepID=A0A8J5YEZ7_9ROSI|nr:hypothetical protein CXB51_017075 [Gossypium anomalum]